MSDEQLIEITRKCGLCKTRYKMLVNKEAHEKWVAGMPSREAFPNETSERRSMIAIGTHSECFDDYSVISQY